METWARPPASLAQVSWVSTGAEAMPGLLLQKSAIFPQQSNAKIDNQRSSLVPIASKVGAHKEKGAHHNYNNNNWFPMRWSRSHRHLLILPSSIHLCVSCLSIYHIFCWFFFLNVLYLGLLNQPLLILPQRLLNQSLLILPQY